MFEPQFHDTRVRPLDKADLKLVLSWRNHPEVRRYMYTKHEITPDEHQDWFDSAQQDPRKHLLVFEANSLPLGFVNFNEYVTRQIANWGYYAAPNAPKGSGRALGRAALNYAFNDIKLHKVCGQALDFNERSIKFHQTFGFQLEGTLRDHHFDGEGYHHVLCFGLLSHEWQPKF